MADFEPVELDFMYGGNTQAEGAKIVKTTEQIAAAHAEAAKMVVRHEATLVELRKDLVELGTAYKQAMSKQQKSEILTEIELTKKNIIDGTQAIKVLKAEIASMNKMPKSAAVPDANAVGKAAVGYSSLNFSTQQLVRELPAASMGLNMFFLAISNNIPVLTDGIKSARAENEALKASGASTTPVWKQLLSSLVSWQSLMMVGITVVSMYGKEIVAWVGELFTGEKALKKITAAQIGLTSANQTMIESLKGSEFQKAVQSIDSLSTALKSAKGNHELGKKAVDDYNASLGVTFGKVNDVDSALKLIDKNKDAYIEAMKAMSFANTFFAKSAEDAMKAMEVGLKNQQQILRDAGQDAKGLWEKLQEFDEQIAKARDEKSKGLNANATVSIGGAFGTQYSMQGAVNERNRIAKEMVKIETDERKRQITAITKHQDESLKLAKSYYKDYTDIFKSNNFVVDDEKNPTAKKTGYPAAVEADVTKQLLGINKELNEKYKKQREDFIKKSQQAQKMGGEKELQELQRVRNEADRIIMQSGSERERIEKEYADKIATLRKDGRFAEIEQLEIDRDKKISAATTGMLKETEIYKIASDGKLDISRQTTEQLIADLQRRINAEIAAGNLSKKEGDKMISDLKKAQTEIEGNQNSNNPFARLGAAITGNSTAQKAYKDGKANKDIKPEDLADLEDAANKSRSAMASAAAESLNGVNAILGSVVGGLDQLGMLSDEQKKDAENVMGMVGGAANIAMGIATGNPIAIIQGSVDLLVNAIEYFDFKNKALEKSQKAHMKNVEDLELKYKKLQRAVETALGTDVYKAQREQIANNKKQIEEYEAWLALEAQKKKKKQDAAKIAETQAAIDDLKASNEGIAQALTESIAQTNVKDLATQLSDALVTAFQNGESAAEAMGNVVDDVLRNAVINALKLKVLDKLLAPAIDQFAIDVESGEGLTGEEGARFRKSVNAAGEAYFKAVNEANDALGGIFDGESAAQSGIKGDVSKMTEETGSALVGQITAMRLNVAALLANSKNSLDTVGKVLASLEAIRVNTVPISEIRDTLNYLKLNGIKVN